MHSFTGENRQPWSELKVHMGKTTWWSWGHRQDLLDATNQIIVAKEAQEECISGLRFTVDFWFSRTAVGVARPFIYEINLTPEFGIEDILFF